MLTHDEMVAKVEAEIAEVELEILDENIHSLNWPRIISKRYTLQWVLKDVLKP